MTDEGKSPVEQARDMIRYLTELKKLVEDSFGVPEERLTDTQHPEKVSIGIDYAHPGSKDYSCVSYVENGKMTFCFYQNPETGNYIIGDNEEITADALRDAINQFITSKQSGT